MTLDTSNNSVRDEGASPLIFESRQSSLGKRYRKERFSMCGDACFERAVAKRLESRGFERLPFQSQREIGHLTPHGCCRSTSRPPPVLSRREGERSSSSLISSAQSIHHFLARDRSYYNVLYFLVTSLSLFCPQRVNPLL